MRNRSKTMFGKQHAIASALFRLSEPLYCLCGCGVRRWGWLLANRDGSSVIYWDAFLDSLHSYLNKLDSLIPG